MDIRDVAIALLAFAVIANFAVDFTDKPQNVVNMAVDGELEERIVSLEEFEGKQMALNKHIANAFTAQAGFNEAVTEAITHS